MDRELWQRIQEIYFRVQELPPEQRDHHLVEACAGDEFLQREVRSLLGAAEAADPILDSPFDDLLMLVEVESPTEAEAVPGKAGPWAIGEAIGRGGMGTVYRARRADGEYNREVALKLVHRLGPTGETARRVRRERRILAALEHPGIARLYDSGVLEDGRPWLAMELVRGEPIHLYCDRLRLSLSERLALFEQVAAAVEYAHRKLVIHRDLKPSNILVTDAGEVKLLDFGIARLLDSAGDELDEGQDDREPLTRPDQRLLTPEYASPEQIRGEPLSTASDVYSLGVLLYLLLAGRRPAGVEAAPPSGIRDLGAAASVRGTTASGLTRALAGELDNLVLKALDPDVERRYSSASALLEDLVRYRTGRPITARPPSHLYRAGRFVRRNRGAVMAAATTVVGVLGGLAIAIQQARIARQERDVAESVSAFMENLFTASDPFESSSQRLDTLRIGAFLDQAADRVDADLQSQPEVRARMQNILGVVHGSVGNFERSRDLLEASVAGFRTLSGDDSPEVAQSLGSLGKVVHLAGDPAGAEPLLREALAISTARFGPTAPEVERIAGELAAALLTQDRLTDAELVLQSAVGEANAVAERSTEPTVQGIANLNLLAGLQYRQGRLDEAIVNMDRAVAMSRDLLGSSHPGTATLAHNLGLALHRRERFAESESALREAATGLREALGAEHPMVAVAMKSLANTLEAADRWPEADDLYREGIDLTRRTVGPQHRDLAIALHDYGGALLRRGELDRAVPLLDESLAVESALFGSRGPGAGSVLGTMAELRRLEGEPAEAERIYGESLAILNENFPDDHPRVLSTRKGLALSIADQGRSTEAKSMLESAYADAENLADGGVAARDIARALATLHEGLANATDAALWRDRASVRR